MSSLPPVGQRLNWPKTTAYSICQSVEYFLQDTRTGFGPAVVLPALAVVKACLMIWPGDWSREIVWINEMFSNIGANGCEIADIF
jgi:hypothetical protein